MHWLQICTSAADKKGEESVISYFAKKRKFPLGGDVLEGAHLRSKRNTEKTWDREREGRRGTRGRGVKSTIDRYQNKPQN